MSEHLTEYAAVGNASLKIDRTSALLRGVKILGLRSTNGREYSRIALQNAITLYDGAKVNVNHPKGATTAVRDYQDRIGHLSDVRFVEEQGLFGDLCYNPKHPLAEQLLWDAEHAPQRVGLSHNVLARTAQQKSKEGESTLVVEEIVKVFSVDLVADPATTSSLFEGNSAESTAVDFYVTSDDSKVIQTENEVNCTIESSAVQSSETTLEQQLQSQREEIERLRHDLTVVREQFQNLEQSIRTASEAKRAKRAKLPISREQNWSGRSGDEKAVASASEFAEAIKR